MTFCLCDASSQCYGQTARVAHVDYGNFIPPYAVIYSKHLMQDVELQRIRRTLEPFSVLKRPAEPSFRIYKSTLLVLTQCVRMRRIRLKMPNNFKFGNVND